MKKYLLTQSFWIVLELLLVAFMIFFLINVVPGDPVRARYPRASEESLELLRHELGYDQPMAIQFFSYLGGFFQGDMGHSIHYDKPVADVLLPRLQISIQLSGAAIVIGFPLGIILGMLAAKFRNTKLDPAIIGFLMVFRSIPTIIFTQFLILLFALQFDLLPASGWEGLFSKNVIIPLIVLVLPGLASGARFTRLNILHVIDEPYIQTAYAKGLPEWKVYLRHILPNAAAPIITNLILWVGIGLIEGFLFVEILYGIRSTGKLILESLHALDYDVIMAICLILSGIFFISRRLSEIGLGILDPRVRVGEAKRF